MPKYLVVLDAVGSETDPGNDQPLLVFGVCDLPTRPAVVNGMTTSAGELGVVREWLARLAAGESIKWDQPGPGPAGTRSAG